jgi:3-(3-hydroxy-phenyl)propionate hydroxylase
MPVEKIHHVAYRCRDAKETTEFYKRVLDMDLVGAFAVGDELVDAEGILAERYDGKPGTTYLVRPDQHVAARWRSFDEAAIKSAIARATGN